MFKALTVVLLASPSGDAEGRPGAPRHGPDRHLHGSEPAGGEAGYWEACRPGRLEGRPDLKRKSCEPVGLAEGVEYWRCPSPIDSASAG